jgi:LysR family hydrogen peroxide-inducible transcriptional activator
MESAMELSQLRYFLKIAEHANITKAGEELGITQPALSRAIAKLEAEIGQPLFERKSRNVMLTDAGRQFQVRAEQILTLVDDTIAELTDREDHGRIRVGAIPTIAPFFLPTVLRDFRDHYPDVQIVAFEETTDKLLQHCNQGEIDVAIVAAPVLAQYLETEPLFEEELLLVLPKDHELADRKSISLPDLRNYPFVLLDEAHCLSETVLAHCRQRSFQPVTVEHTSQLATVEELVALGHGVSLIPRMARNVDTSDRRIYRSITRPAPFRTIMLVWNVYRFQSRRLERFKECARRVAASLKVDRVNDGQRERDLIS